MNDTDTNSLRTPWQPKNPMGPLGITDRAQCAARSKRSGERCRAYPMHGAKVCSAHGGMAKQVREAAKRRVEAAKVEREVRDVIAFEAVDGIDDPLEALSRLATEALAMKEQLAARVNSLKQVRYTAHGAGTEQLRAEVALYERAMDRSAKFLKLLVDSGFEERRTQLAEQQGKLVVQALRRIFEALGLDERQQALVSVVVPRELRAISGEVVR